MIGKKKTSEFPASRSIPPGFERDATELQRLAEVARTDPRLQNDRIAVMERILRRLPRGKYIAFQVGVLNELGNAYARLPAWDQTANLEKAIGCYTEALRFLT